MTTVKKILNQKDIDRLKEGDVVGISPIAKLSRFGGIKDSMFVFGYRTGGFKIWEVWAERKHLFHGNGEIVLSTDGGPYEPIPYSLERNPRLYEQKDAELRRAGI